MDGEGAPPYNRATALLTSHTELLTVHDLLVNDVSNVSATTQHTRSAVH